MSKRWALAPLSVALTLLFPAVSSAATLSDIYREAKQNDPKYKAAVSRHNAAIEIYPQAQALRRPQISASANMNYNSITPLAGPGVADAGSSNTSDFGSNGVKLEVVQSIFNVYKKAEVEKSRLKVLASELELQKAEQELAIRISSAYFDTLEAQDKLEHVRAQKIAVAEQLAIAKRSFEVGAVPITDADEAQARFDRISAEEIAAQDALVLKSAALEQLVGRPVQQLAALQTEALPLTDPLNHWIQKTDQQNLSLMIAQTNRKIAQINIQSSKAGHYPTLDLVGSIARNRSGGGAGTVQVPSDSLTKTVTLQLYLPFYTGGRTSSLVRQAVAEESAAIEEQRKAQLQAEQETREAFLGTTSGRVQISAYDRVVKSLQTLVHSTRTGQQVGIRTTLDILNAEQDLYRAKNQLSAARYAYMLNYLRLKFAIGTLSEADLQRIHTESEKQSAPQDPLSAA